MRPTAHRDVIFAESHRREQRIFNCHVISQQLGLHEQGGMLAIAIACLSAYAAAGRRESTSASPVAIHTHPAAGA